MKRKTLILSVLLCALLLGSCGSQSAAKHPPVSEVAAAVTAAIGKSDAMMEMDGNFLGMTRLSAEQLGEHTVLMNAYGANIDEFGVFQAGAMSVRELQTAVEDYLDKRRSAWMEEYMPEEKPKLTDAEVRVNGDYVMYCILSEGDKATAFQTFADQLK